MNNLKKAFKSIMGGLTAVMLVIAFSALYPYPASSLVTTLEVTYKDTTFETTHWWGDATTNVDYSPANGDILYITEDFQGGTRTVEVQITNKFTKTVRTYTGSATFPTPTGSGKTITVPLTLQPLAP